MKRIIIDTNFLMIPGQFRVDIYSEFRRICNFNYGLFIFEQSIYELKNTVRNAKKGRDKKAAQFALKLIKLKNINLIKSENKDVDSLILENADNDTVVASQDILLRKNLLKKQVSVIILRQKKYLQLIEKAL